MEKHIATWSYWLGIVSAVVALVSQGLGAVGALLHSPALLNLSIFHASFYMPAILFFLVAIATGSHISSGAQKG